MENHEIIRSMIKSENEFMNHRMAWISAFNGFLFAGTSFGWEKSRVLVTVLAFLGMAISLSSAASLIAANRAFRELYDWWQKKKPAGYDGPDVIGLPPRYKAGAGTWLNPWSIVPFLSAGAWLIIAITRLMT